MIWKVKKSLVVTKIMAKIETEYLIQMNKEDSVIWENGMINSFSLTHFNSLHGGLNAHLQMKLTK